MKVEHSSHWNKSEISNVKPSAKVQVEHFLNLVLPRLRLQVTQPKHIHLLFDEGELQSHESSPLHPKQPRHSNATHDEVLHAPLLS